MEHEVRCSACSYSTPKLLDFKCPSCGQPLDMRQSRRFETSKLSKENYSVWRYARLFPYVNEADIVTLGEGWTPVVQFSKTVRFKLESLNPTGSFKDRGSTVLISALHRLVKESNRYICEDSSGNAGASMAAYAARAGVRAKIFVPENVSGPKFNQVQFYGAEVIKVPGSRARVAEEAQRPSKSGFYVGHILHPLFRDGIRSLAYEVAEQLDCAMPHRVYLPVSAGTLLLGIIQGFNDLVESDMIRKMPEITACQTRQVSPLYHLFKNLSYQAPERVTSIADALVSVDPPLLSLMAKRLKAVDGDAVMVEEDEVLKAFRELAQNGFFVEPSSAVAYAGYKKQLLKGEVSESDEALIILTGTGLKARLQPE